MNPSNFEQSNAVMDTPSGTSIDDVEPLYVWRGRYYEGGTPAVISCWKVNQEEIEEIQRTGRVWLSVLGAGMPPVCLTTKDPFE